MAVGIVYTVFGQVCMWHYGLRNVSVGRCVQCVAECVNGKLPEGLVSTQCFKTPVRCRVTLFTSLSTGKGKCVDTDKNSVSTCNRVTCSRRQWRCCERK